MQALHWDAQRFDFKRRYAEDCDNYLKAAGSGFGKTWFSLRKLRIPEGQSAGTNEISGHWDLMYRR